jgi:AhpD family alkylhydroperoxidase
MPRYDGFMQARFDYQKASPTAARAMYALSAYIQHSSGLEHSLLELVKTRASQMNGCAFCIDMHTKDARAAGETEQRLYALNAWRETDFYTDRERAALLWTESLTEIRSTGGIESRLRLARWRVLTSRLLLLRLGLDGNRQLQLFSQFARAQTPCERGLF